MQNSDNYNDNISDIDNSSNMKVIQEITNIIVRITVVEVLIIMIIIITILNPSFS